MGALGGSRLRANLVVTFFVLTLLVAPAASGAWRGPGGLEPDTRDDAQQGTVWSEPDIAADGARIYFHAWQAVEPTAHNPNVATLGSRFLLAPTVHHRAFLGVWKDCNADGYIGQAETAVQDYAAAALLDTTICPPQTNAGQPVHNDGMWVSEYLAIGMVDPCEFASEAARRAQCPGIDAFARNERVHYANDTYVWGDLGAPGSIPREECVLAPLPRGSTTGSGALIGTLDCQSQRGIANAIDSLDSDGSLGLRFEDTSRPQDSSSTLNQRFPITPFGRPGEAGILERRSDQRSATVWDCRAPKAEGIRVEGGPRELVITDPSGRLNAETFPFVVPFSVTGIGFRDEDGDPSTPGVVRIGLTDDEGRYLWAPTPAPSLDDPAGSSWATLDHAADGPNGDCDPSTASPLDAAYPGTFIENDQSPILEGSKDRPSFTLTFYDGHRGLHPSLDPTTGEGAPSDGGLVATDPGRGGDGPMWSALSTSDQDPQLVNRHDLGPTPARYFTYYAHVGNEALSKGLALRQPNALLLYGSENCGPHTSGTANGWVCDPDLWWKDQQGNDNQPRHARGEPIGRVVRDPYHMRDVDCYDGAIVAGLGVHASLVDVSDEGACQEASSA